MATTVYSKPACPACTSTYRKLDKEKLAYDVVDITQDVEAYAFIKSLGYMQAPVVVTDEDHWSGFQPDKITLLKESLKEAA